MKACFSVSTMLTTQVDLQPIHQSLWWKNVKNESVAAAWEQPGVSSSSSMTSWKVCRQNGFRQPPYGALEKAKLKLKAQMLSRSIGGSNPTKSLGGVRMWRQLHSQHRVSDSSGFTRQSNVFQRLQTLKCDNQGERRDNRLLSTTLWLKTLISSNPFRPLKSHQMA